MSLEAVNISTITDDPAFVQVRGVATRAGQNGRLQDAFIKELEVVSPGVEQIKQ